MMEKGLRGPLCSMALLGYHTVMTYVLGMNLNHFENLIELYKIRRIKMLYQSRTRIHSSRMRTARSSSCHGGWAWTRYPSTSPLGVGLDKIPLNFPLGCGPGPDPLNVPLGCGPGNTPWDQAPPRTRHTLPRDQAHPPVNRITDTCKNITLPQTSFAGGNNK